MSWWAVHGMSCAAESQPPSCGMSAYRAVRGMHSAWRASHVLCPLPPNLQLAGRAALARPARRWRLSALGVVRRCRDRDDLPRRRRGHDAAELSWAFHRALVSPRRRRRATLAGAGRESAPPPAGRHAPVRRTVRPQRGARDRANPWSGREPDLLVLPDPGTEESGPGAGLGYARPRPLREGGPR